MFHVSDKRGTHRKVHGRPATCIWHPCLCPLVHNPAGKMKRVAALGKHIGLKGLSFDAYSAAEFLAKLPFGWIRCN